MKILVEYTALLDLKGVPNGSLVDVPDGSTISDLLTRCGVEAAHQKYIAPFINSEKKPLRTILRDGDHLVLSLPIGGG